MSDAGYYICVATSAGVLDIETVTYTEVRRGMLLLKILFSVNINRGYYMATRGYEFYLRVLKLSLTSERSERVRDTFSTRI